MSEVQHENDEIPQSRKRGKVKEGMECKEGNKDDMFEECVRWGEGHSSEGAETRVHARVRKKNEGNLKITGGLREETGMEHIYTTHGNATTLKLSFQVEGLNPPKRVKKYTSSRVEV